MDRIRERFRWFNRGNRVNESLPPALPCLPDERPRPLTATPCSPAATSHSSLFQLVPPEIRRAILIEAFGERTLHFDVRLEHPLRKVRANGKNGMKSATQCDGNKQLFHGNQHMFHRKVRDPRQPREWTWWSSVCHRNFPSRHFHRSPPGDRNFVDPAEDRCRRPYGGQISLYCEYYPGTMPSKCFIGVLPWLLTCRQAYIEGIDILYATNRLHIAHAGILINLTRFLTPERLQMIRDVELVWSLCLSSSGADREWTIGAEEDQFRDVYDRLTMLSHIPRVLPNLQLLHLSFKDGGRALGTVIDADGLCGPKLYDATETLLRSIDTMVLMQLARLRECRISLPTSLYWTRVMLEKHEHDIWSLEAPAEALRLWRTIDYTVVSTQPTTERCNKIEGYWITHGELEFWDPTYLPSEL
ncbi:hypothetical protein PG985_007027 [Apiospora marii]|uniref:DUF7730 domain-containing protein n=1 Tax=Apiospora marii TaxID=335849 RepID=A0ABR1SGW5_9PEZI